MRLTRIDAIQFGALEGSCLPDVGGGLTVVYGPNECGKSTYTALVRHVLFGFPMGKGKAGERFYKPPAGARAARLTFADESGEWAIERVEGKRGGDVTVSARRGAERPDLLPELVGDLTEASYRVVFGFGLDEMADIENGDDRYLGARLYAAGSGLEVNPLDVRETLQKSADALFAPRARISAVNAGANEIKTLRDEIRALEAEASAYADEQARAVRLAGELEPIRAARDLADAEARALERDAQRARDLAASATELADQRDEGERSLASLDRTVHETAIDDRVLAVAPELGALLDEQSGFRQRVQSMRAQDSALTAARARLQGYAGLPAAAVDSVESRARVDTWAARRASLEGEIRAAESQAAQGEARAKEYSGQVAAPAATPRRSLLAAGVIVLGVAFAVAGVLASQMLATVLGAVVLAGGIALSFVRGRGSDADMSGDARRAAAEARAARTVAEAARATLESETGQWRAWLGERALDTHGDDPVAVRALLDELRERASAAAEVARIEAALRADSDLADAWAGRLASVAGAFMDVAGAGIDEIGGVAARAREALDAARAAAERRGRALDERQVVASGLETTLARLEAQQRALEALATAHGVSADDAVPRLEVLAAARADELEALRADFEARADELSKLRGLLGTDGRDDAMALARQRMEGLQARVQADAERYVVDALAVRLLDRARERYERERQPEVTRVAARVFAAMTNGRYTDVLVPLGGEGIRVVTAAGGSKTTTELSRGTAEQLYLALRVGFLTTLKAGTSLPVLMDDVVVNFDAERRAGAAAAIAELARERQVVFFTCHEETAAVLAEAVPGRVALTLDRCRLKG